MDGVLEYIALGNGILLAAFLILWLIELGLKKTKYRNAYRLRLNLAVAALCAAALPIVLAPFGTLIASFLTINATDLLVSQYLKGNLSLTATQVTQMVDVKNGLVPGLVSAATYTSIVAIVVFLIAAVLRSGYIALNIYRIRRIIGGAQLYRSTSRVSILTSDQVEIPFSTRGMFNYVIVLPTSMLADFRATRIALGHEAQHIRQRDVDWEILLSLISPLFVANPAFWFISDRFRKFREYVCDAAFLRNRNFDAKEYCLLLLQIASNASRKSNRGMPAYATSVPFFGRDGFFNRSNKNALRHRVIALSDDGGYSESKLSEFFNFVPAALLLGFVALIIVSASKPADWSHDRIMLSTVINLERLDRINGFGVQPLR